MIKFTMTSDKGRKVLGLILVKGNIKYLTEGSPIHFNAEEMGLPMLEFNEIIIHYMENQEDAIKMLRENNLIGPETTVHDTRKKTRQ